MPEYTIGHIPRSPFGDIEIKDYEEEKIFYAWAERQNIPEDKRDEYVKSIKSSYRLREMTLLVMKDWALENMRGLRERYVGALLGSPDGPLHLYEEIATCKDNPSLQNELAQTAQNFNRPRSSGGHWVGSVRHAERSERRFLIGIIIFNATLILFILYVMCCT